MLQPLRYVWMRLTPCVRWLAVWLVVGSLSSARAEEPVGLPSPLGLDAALAVAREQRAEIGASRARARAAEQEPGVVYPLEDPMLMPMINHLPLRFDGLDVAVLVEQRMPLSRLRRHRRDAAIALRDRALAGVSRTTLDVALAATEAFFMLWMRREMARILERQLELSAEFVAAAEARYASATGPQSDVLRAEIEVSRIKMQKRALSAEISAAEAMLRASLGLPPETVMPALAAWTPSSPAPSSSTAVGRAYEQRPELAAGRAEIRGAEADVRAMRSMYAPMGLLRTGPAYTMTDGPGVMLAFGISLPRRNRVRAQVQQAEAMAAMTRSDLAAMRRMIEGEVSAAQGYVAAAQARVDSLRDDVLPRAGATIEPTLAGYAAGQLPLVSVIEAARALWAVQMDLVTAQAELGIAWAELRRAIGEDRP